MTESAPLPKGYAPTLDVRSVPWTSLRPHPRNPRQGDVEAIGESVDSNGVYRPIIVALDGTIIAGHHLYEALGERGGGNVDVVVLPYEPFSDQALRIMAADNRTADLGGYDDALLLALLGAIAETDEGLQGTGYEPDAVDEIAAAIRRAEHTPLGYKADEPAPPAPPGEGDAEPARSGNPEGGQSTPDRPAGSLQDDASRYESKGLRYVQVEFPASVYPQIVAGLKAKRDEFGVTTNTEAVGRWLGVEIPLP